MGKTIVAGGGRATVPISGIKASNLSVGSVVKLMENGTAVEYLVVHQGLPSSMYDASCNGTWLLRKDLYDALPWNSTNTNDYKDSSICKYYVTNIFNKLGEIEQSAIKQVKLPYVNGTASNNVYTVSSGSEGIETKAFLLSGYEIGFTQESGHSGIPIDGAKLDYFAEGSSADTKRVAYLDGVAKSWWTRSPFTASSNPETAVIANPKGAWSNIVCTHSAVGLRPAFVLSSTAVFDKTTLILKGVA